MKRSSRGYDGLPIEMPRINLIQALQSVAEGLGGTTQAKQIEALYVLSRRTVSKETVPTAVPCREAPCTRWEITLRYLPPVRPIGLAGPGGKRPRITLPPFMHFRHDVDPGTGKWLRAETVP